MIPSAMKVEVLPDPEAVARRAARRIAETSRQAATARGRFLLALSGGATPWRMMEHLAAEDVPWARVQVFQVDERVASASDTARNFTRLREALLERVDLPDTHVHPMPVEEEDLSAAAARYAATLRGVAGSPPVLDLIHLGLGADGHTASLFPGDPAPVGSAPGIGNEEIALTGPYGGYRRMTLTYTVLASARALLWVVTGADKIEALRRLRRGDDSIPAGRVPAERALLLVDAAAAP